MKWHAFDEIQGCGVLEYPRHCDDRGYFQENLNRKTLASEGIPLPWSWAQDNTSFTYAGVIRGFHLQKNNPQGKLVTCIYGKIMDVCLDLRMDSPTFMKMTRIMLDGDTPQSFYLPAGTAHAFVAFEDSIIHYKCTTPYDAESDSGINACSEELQFVWPPGKYIRSEKDQNLQTLRSYLGLLPKSPPSA